MGNMYKFMKTTIRSSVGIVVGFPVVTGRQIDGTCIVLEINS